VKGHNSSDSVVPACYQGLCSAKNVGMLLSADTFRMVLWTIPHMWCVPMTLLVGVKQTEHEAVHSALSSVGVKNSGVLFPAPCSPHSLLG
jgi:hypothetical protein